MGTTVFVADSTMTGDTPALEVFSTAQDGAPQLLTADAARRGIAVQIGSTDPAVFAIGDAVLLYSNREVDTESPGKHAGELKVVTGWDPTVGTLTLDDQIFDAYTQADSAAVVRVTMLRNVTLSDFSITTNAASSTLKVGFTHFRFVDDLQVERVEVHDAYFSGIHLQSVRNSVIRDCYIHHISDIVPVNPPAPANERYGIAVGGASQNVSISGCRFSHTRHAVTTGGSSGKNHNGVQRNIVVANCTSMLADTAHFDTHQPAENVTFVGCVADGGMPVGGLPPAANVCGFQMRARNSSIVGCSVLQAVGRGIMIFGPASSAAVISANMIAGVAAIRNHSGTGIYFDSQGTSNDRQCHQRLPWIGDRQWQIEQRYRHHRECYIEQQFNRCRSSHRAVGCGAHSRQRQQHRRRQPESRDCDARHLRQLADCGQQLRRRRRRRAGWDRFHRDQ
jgi:hypothetical protein